MMSNGLTISYPYQRQALSAPLMVLLFLCLLLLHFVILRLASIQPPELIYTATERQLHISLAQLPMQLPSQDEPAQPKATPVEPKVPEEKAPEPPAKSVEQAVEKKEPEPAAPPPAPEEKQPEPRPDPASVAQRNEPNLSPMNESRTADDTAAGQEKPPQDARYEGATNTEAADHSKKEKIGLDPKIDGESGEVRFAGRRGENENKEAKRDDPTTGSIEKEGSPEPGKPPEPQTQVALLPEPEPAKVPEPVAPPDPEAPGKVTPAGVDRPEETVAKPAAKEPEPDGIDPLKQMTPMQEEAQRIENAAEKAVALKPDVDPPDPKENLRRPAPERDEPKPAHVQNPVPRIDPELARIQRLLEKPQAAPETARVNPGAGTRSGQVGHEGDGRERDGELNAISDVMSATLTSAAKEGDVAFSKRATPENAYLKPFFRRMDAKWKAVFYTDNRALSRLEFGTVQVRFTLDKSGNLLEVVELARTGTVSDSAVRACLEGLRRAAPHDAFPPSLGGREKLTDTIVFLYR